MLPKYDLDTIAARLRGRSTPESTHGEKQAAVAAILRPGPNREAELLLMRRAEREDDPWSGHMALPGGRRDPEDADLLTTARREAHEEVGIDLAKYGRLLGRLPDLSASGRGISFGLVISPFVFALEEDVPVTPNEEVAEALWTPLAPLARGETAAPYSYDYKGQKLDLPSLRVGDRVVWGLTYRMLEMLFDVLHGGS